MTKVLVDGRAEGPLIVLTRPLSFWGGVDPATGIIVDRSHPALGRSVAGVILAMPHGRGSSSSATVLAELIRLGTGPLGILLGEPDEIIVTGAFVANSLYGANVPVVVGALPDTGDGEYRLDRHGCRRLGAD